VAENYSWPLPPPRQWLATVNRPQSESELAALRRSVNQGTSFGTDRWQTHTAKHSGSNGHYEPAAARESRRFSSTKELLRSMGLRPANLQLTRRIAHKRQMHVQS